MLSEASDWEPYHRCILVSAVVQHHCASRQFHSDAHQKLAIADVRHRSIRNLEIFGSPFAPTLRDQSGEANSSLGIANEAFTPAILGSNLARNAALRFRL